jgi:hypothetical protein
VEIAYGTALGTAGLPQQAESVLLSLPVASVPLISPVHGNSDTRLTLAECAIRDALIELK